MKPLLRVLNGEAVWPPPVWLMRQAGRYLPEFRALRERADFITRCMTPDLATEITLQPIRRFRMDGAILFSDILILPWAMGQALRFDDGVGPVLEPIRTAADLDRLRPDAAAERTEPVMETLRRLRRALADPGAGAPGGTTSVGAPGGTTLVGAPGGTTLVGAPGGTTLIGFAGAPFTVACYMVDGGGSKEFAATRRMAWTEPALFDRLMALLVDQTAALLCRQIEAGAEAVMLFDSWAGLLPPSQFRRHVIEPARRIRAIVRERHPGVPFVGFPRLGGTLAPEYAARSGVDALALDTGADPAAVAGRVSPRLALQGNLDPLCLLAGGAALDAEAEAIRSALRGRPHVFNLGHGVLPQTPPEHVAALVEAVRR